MEKRNSGELSCPATGLVIHLIRLWKSVKKYLTFLLISGRTSCFRFEQGSVPRHWHSKRFVMETPYHQDNKYYKQVSWFLEMEPEGKAPNLEKRAYKAIVHPKLEYAAPVRDPHTLDDTQKIEIVQRRAARWVLSDYSPYSSVSDLLGKLGRSTLEQRVLSHDWSFPIK